MQNAARRIRLATAEKVRQSPEATRRPSVVVPAAAASGRPQSDRRRVEADRHAVSRGPVFRSERLSDLATARCSCFIWRNANQGRTSMFRRTGVILTALACLWISSAMAQPKPIALWHVFNLETDMIYGGIKSFNESQTAYRIDARL